MVNKYLQFIVVGFWSLALAGCSSNFFPDATPLEVQEQSSNQASLEQVLSGDHLVAVADNNQIYISDTTYPQAVSVYTMKGDENLPVFKLFDIKISPTKKYLAWYTPLKGLLALDIQTQTVITLIEANSWLNTNPFFQFDTEKDLVYIVDNEGTVLYAIDIPTQQTQATEIPFPFGTIFKISPDKQTILFISAFGQTDEMPEFMFTSIDGSNPVRFNTDTRLNQRFMVEWLPDSSGVILISGDEQQIIQVPKNSTTPITYYDHPQESTIDQLAIVDDLVYYYTSDNRWHVIDTKTLTEVGRIPREIAEEIHRPRFIPWYDKTFLIEETLRYDPEQFKRLWVSTYMGIKKSIFSSYDEIKIETGELEL